MHYNLALDFPNPNANSNTKMKNDGNLPQMEEFLPPSGVYDKLGERSEYDHLEGMVSVYDHLEGIVAPLTFGLCKPRTRYRRSRDYGCQGLNL